MAAGRRLLLRSPKDTFEVATPEQTVDRNLIGLNSGNLIFLGASQKVLGAPGVVVETDRFRIDPADAGRINEQYDAYVIPLANAFRPRYEAQLVRLTELLRRLTIPVTILGVGVDGTVDGDTSVVEPMAGAVRDFVAAALERGPSIGVRGEITAGFVRRLGFRDVEVIGCPSMFLDGPHLEVTRRTSGLAADDPLVITISPYLREMGPIVRHHLERYPNLAYVAQDLDTLEMLVYGTPFSGGAPDDPLPRHPEHPLVRSGRTRQYVDPWPWIRDLRDAAFVFGSRIHGTIAALLGGTPGYLLAHDARTVELARYFDIPYRALRDTPRDVDAAELYEAADFGRLLAGHRERWDRFAAYLAGHGLEHAFARPGSAEAFALRVAATDYPPAVTALTTQQAAARSGLAALRGLPGRLRRRMRRTRRSDAVRELRRRLTRRRGTAVRPSVIRDTQVVDAVTPPAPRLVIEADVDRLAEVRAFVREAVGALGGSDRVAEDLVQATDEATCNVMLHGYAGRPGEIELSAALRNGSIEITIADRAPLFDPTAPPDPAVPAPPRRRRVPGTAGVGLHLARTMTDAVRHHVRPDGGNELTLVRSIEGPATDGPAEEG